MKIALTFPGCHRRGGVERVMFECANFLGKRGHDVTIHASDWGDMSTLDSRVKRQMVPTPQRPPIVRLLSFHNKMRHRLPDSDVTGGFGVLAPPGAVVWAQSVHRAWLDISHSQRTLHGRLKQWCNPVHPLVLAMEQQYFGQRRYGKMIALTGDVKNDLMRYYQVPADDIVVIPNGFAANEFNPEQALSKRDTVRASLGYGTTEKVVIFVANELERKGFGPLLRAMASMGDARLRLLAVGRLDQNAYAAEIKSLGMADRVKFTGPTENVADFYAGADIFALPTQYEAWGLVIVEALACGLPVLTSRLAGAAVVVREGETGELLDSPHNSQEIATKLSAMLDRQAPHRSDISQSVEEYAWHRVLETYESVLSHVSTASGSNLVARGRK